MRKIKVLLTGFKGTDNKRDSRKRFLDLIDFIDKSLLEDDRFEVDRRVVTSGENLSRYDISLVFVNDCTSITSGNIFGALWAMMRSKVVLPVIVDWRFYNFQKNMYNCYCKHDFKTNCEHFLNNGLVKNGSRLGAEEAKKYAKEFIEYMKKITTKGYGDILIWTYNWKNLKSLDREKLLCKKIFTVDPSAYMLKRKIGSVRTIRKEGWVLDALSDVTKCVDHTKNRSWPIIAVGHPSIHKLPNAVSAFPGKFKASFKDSSGLYAQYYGATGFSFPHSGVGWWRQRPILAANNLTVYVGDDEEKSLMGKPYHLSIKDVERCNDLDIFHLANMQREWFIDHTDSKDEFERKLASIIQEKIESRG